MTAMLPQLRDALLALQQRDFAVRAELEADGTLFEGYHPRMEAVHLDNATQLRNLIASFGWPNEQLAGPDGAEAAWLIAQHSIAEPDFMRSCRELIRNELADGRVPLWQYAYIDDRIRVSEGKPQRYGTQIELTPDGPVLCEVEDPQALESLRLEVGLPPAGERLQRMAAGPRPTPEEFKERKKLELLWRQKVGWAAADDS